MPDPTLFNDDRSRSRPLADQMRPTTLDDFLGQEHILGEGKPLREAILKGEVTSMVFWGPPGSGKTTLARIVAHYTDRHFEAFSAVTEGIPRVREIIKEAKQRLEYEGRGTILFCDEIHRFNKAQQDAFLPWVERGIVTLIGATTENPSFELNSALLSRLRVFVLEPLEADHIRDIILRALRAKGNLREKGKEQGEKGKGKRERGSAVEFSDEALEVLVRHADGDARQVLNALEAITEYVGSNFSLFPFPLSLDTVESVLAKRLPVYDKSGDSHYNIISALHKAVRGSDVEGALYWLARMISAGEDPLFIARRVVRMASEDIGLADPRALSIALAAKDAFHFLGSPEGELAIAEAVIYLATAPKSNRVYDAWSKALRAAEEHPNEPVPLHIRNAPTGLMKELGYGKGYRYDPAEDSGLAAGQEYLPDALRDATWYEPTEFGFERDIAKRLKWWEGLKQRERGKGKGEKDVE